MKCLKPIRRFGAAKYAYALDCFLSFLGHLSAYIFFERFVVDHRGLEPATLPVMSRLLDQLSLWSTFLVSIH